jgi:DNA polymerase I-like protein with 3'-5' exonuclease and polymerase domains
MVDDHVADRRGGRRFDLQRVAIDGRLTASGIAWTGIQALDQHLQPQLEAAEAKCIAIADFKNFNPRSPKQISEALDRLGADVRFMTRQASGLLKTDEENLDACDHPLADAILAYRSLHKIWTMVHRMIYGKPGDDKFPLPYIAPDGRLHPSFNQVGARTGRMSCSNPNFQQINRDDLRIRYAVRAEPGMKLVTCDLDSIELKLLAAFAGGGALREAMVDPTRDLHVETAEVAGLRGRQRSSGFESPRDQGKRMNYLTIYGGGVNAIRKWFGISQNEARGILQAYHRAYPEVGAFQDRIEAALIDKGYVKTPLGRRQRAYSSDSAYKEAYKFVNYLIQGTAADMLKQALAEVHRQGVPIVAAVHDELIAHVPEKDAAEAARIIEQAMTNHPQINEKVPITAEAQIVDCWADAKKPGYTPEFMEN